MDVGGDDASQLSSSSSTSAAGGSAAPQVALITYKRRRTGGAARMRRISDTHTSAETAETSKESKEEPGEKLFSSESACLHELSTMWKRSSLLLKRTEAPKRAIGQYFLDLGQADFSHTTCPSCGLVYARGEETDEKLHTSFHKSQLQGIQFRGWQHERVAVKLSSKGDRIIYVLPGDPTCHLYKVQEMVVRVMEQEMGLALGWLWQQHCKVYLFISASKKIVGCILCEPIKCAFPIVASHQQNTAHSSQPCAQDMSQQLVPALDLAVDINSDGLKCTDVRVMPSTPPLLAEGMDPLGEGQSNISDSCRELGVGKFIGENKASSTELTFGDWKFTREVVRKKQRRFGDQEDLGRVVLCSKIAVPAVCGVRGIWVSCSERRKGIASHLLDAMRTTFCSGLTLQTSQCAFSQPTPDGQAFAARYCRNPSFLVYQLQ